MPSRVLNGMVASWIALDPVTEWNGPLQYYPGSHKIKPYVFNPEHSTLQNRIRAIPGPGFDSKMENFREYIQKELNLRKISPVVFYAKPGE